MKIIPFFLISLLLLSFLSSTLSQPQSEDESDAQSTLKNSKIYYNSFKILYKIAINQEEVESQNDGKFNEAQINSMRTRTMSCILFTKHKIYSIQKELGGILEGYSSKQSEQNSLYRKIFSEMLENCYGHISDQEGQKVIISYYRSM